MFQGERQFTADNKSLGNFELSGIAPAPRGVPQIEVTFDIDANGIVHVSAKDLGTGKETAVTITGGSALSKEEIDRMVNEAAQHEEDDKKRREELEIRNSAEQLVYTIEKTLKEDADKVSEATRQEVQGDLDAVKEALKGSDIEAVKSSVEKLNQSAMKIGQEVYQNAQAAQAAAEAGASQESSSSSDDDVIDAEVVDEDDK